MGGNVAEWVADVYRPIIDDDASDFNYYRGNIYTKINKDGKVYNENDFKEDSEEITWKRLPNGRIHFINLPNEISSQSLDSLDLLRTNYTKSNNINFNDGDVESSRNFSETNNIDPMYDSNNTLISNETRVYKGGSWLDRAYYLDPAQRRYLPEYMTTNFIGFRCAMSYVGDSKNIKKPKKR